jgi:hypothetical protein
VTENLFEKIHADARWLPFLRKVGRAPEQLGEDRVRGDAAAGRRQHGERAGASVAVPDREPREK